MEQRQLLSRFLGIERERMIQTGQLLPCGESMIQCMNDIDFYCAVCLNSFQSIDVTHLVAITRVRTHTHTQ